jgi:hypothetical protein
MSAIMDLTPYMREYARDFADTGDINWLPYLMYFHPFSYSSSVVSTDASGFRYSEARGRRYSAADLGEMRSVRLLAGSSTVFGIGATADRHTLASRLTENDLRAEFWVNFGGRSFNSTQELILFALNRHQLPAVKEILLFSGFNDLGLARLPTRLRMEHGAFFMCREFFDAMAKKKPSCFANWFRRDAREDDDEDQLTTIAQITFASNLTLRRLDIWRALASDLGAQLAFVLQPLANWVRTTGSPEEERLFADLERSGAFSETYGGILTTEAHHSYAKLLRMGAEGMGVRFVDFAPILGAVAAPDRWLFVDRIHFTDDGYDFISRLLLETLDTKRVAQ